MGLPTTFDMDSKSKLMYILPLVSLALPQVANRTTPSVAEQEGQLIETEATGAPQKHHHTLNQ